MSYLYLGQTSNDNGTRDEWTGSTPAQTSGHGNGVIAQVLTDVASSAFDESVLQGLVWAPAESYLDGQLLAADASRALYDLSGANAGTMDASFNTNLNSALAAKGNLLGVVGTQFIKDGSANNRTLDDASGYTATLGVQKLDLGLADVNWNDIKNVEVFIDSSDTGTGYDAVALRSFVDARIKIGDTAGCRDAAELVNVLNGTAARFDVELVDGKRGQVAGAQSDLALDVEIDVWTNSTNWQSSFSNQGSVFGDVFTISYGSLAVTRGISEFGLGAGTLVDADDTTFGTDKGQQSAYNGQLTTLFTNLGSGDDRYDATVGVQVVASGLGTAIAAAELQTVDYVWGGSGDDVIDAGGNNDVLFGDFGSSGGVGQTADPAALSLKLGASGDGYANWAVAGVVSEVWQQNLGGAKLVATAANWDGQFQLNAGYGTALVSGGVGVGAHTGTGGNNGANGGNPEINTGTRGITNNNAGDDDVLGVTFVAQMAAAKVGFGLFYADEGVERALVTLTNGGAEVATYEVQADGTITFETGTDLFDLSLADGGDTWDGSNPGDSTLTITARPGATFDGMEFRSGGNNGANEVSDFYLRDICGTLAATDGNDTIAGGGDNGSFDTLTSVVIVGDDITGGGGNDTIIWSAGDGLDVVRDFNVNGDVLIFNDNGARTLSTITFNGVESTLVRTSGTATDGVVLQGVKVGDLGPGDIPETLIVSFDDIALGEGGEQKIADGYQGFNWTQTGAYNPDGALNYLESSPQNVGFIAEANNGEIGGYDDAGETAGAPVVITRADDFDFVGGDFTPQGRAGMVVTVEGWDDGVLKFSQNVVLGTINPDSSTSASFAFASIDELRFNANDGDAGTNDYFGFDDLHFLV